MTKKDDLYDKALKDFDVKLDRRLTLSQLQDQMARLEQEQKDPQKEIPKLKPKRVRNVITGNEFDYHELFAGDPDLQVIEWEEEDGND